MAETYLVQLSSAWISVVKNNQLTNANVLVAYQI